MRLSALGGSFNGSAGIEEMARFHLSGNLRNFDIERVARVFMSRNLGYSGIVSGPVQAAGKRFVLHGVSQGSDGYVLSLSMYRGEIPKASPKRAGEC